MVRHFLSLFVVCLVVSTYPAFAQEGESEQRVNIESILNRVAIANRYNHYQGVLTYGANGDLYTAKISHYVDYEGENHRIYEQLEFMNGQKRQVIREQSIKACDKGSSRWGVWPYAFDVESLYPYYDIQQGKSVRIAGRSAFTLFFTPKDEFRYAYEFNFDQETGVLLRSIVKDGEQMIERAQYADIRYFNHHEEMNLSQPVHSWRVPEADPCHTNQFQSAWTVEWLPPGFLPAGNRVTVLGEQVQMFSDGLVSISVFITNDRQESIPKITARRGATVAVLYPLPFDKTKRVAVVGEIPPIVAQKIAVSIIQR